jgi:cubilin
LQFDLEESEYCNRDYVEIHRDSAEGPILGHFCGNNVPTNVTTADRQGWPTW